MIFFDIDGTLLDHKQSEHLGVKLLLKEYKSDFNISEDTFYQCWCDLAEKHFTRYLNKETTFIQRRIERIKGLFKISHIELTDNEAVKIFDKYLKGYEKNWKPYEDVIPCLEKFSKYQLGIISNGDFEQQTSKLERMGISHYFTQVITAGEIGIAKPNPEIFQIACNRAGEKPQKCWYIGDDFETDITPANEIGMHGIWLNRGHKKVTKENINEIYGLDELFFEFEVL